LHSNGAASCPYLGRIYQFDGSSPTLSDNHQPPWRGSLLPLGGEAAAEQINAIHLTNRAHRFGTASHPSGSKLPRHIEDFSVFGLFTQQWQLRLYGWAAKVN